MKTAIYLRNQKATIHFREISMDQIESGVPLKKNNFIFTHCIGD